MNAQSRVPPTPTDVLAARVRELRERQGLSAQALADRCAGLGAPHLKRVIISNIETRRRADVSIEELTVLARALNVAPVHLIVPTDDRPMRIGETTVDSGRVREWVRGNHPGLPGTDERIYAAEAPDEEWEPPRRATARETYAALQRMADELGATFTMTNRETGETIEGGPS